MNLAELLAAGGSLALAALLGVSDAPNAVAPLVSSRTRAFLPVAGWSVLWHLAGGLLAGTLVARTTVGLVHVPARSLAAVLAAGCWAAVAFTWAATRLGLPASASVSLVGGLTGAAIATGGLAAVNWGGLEGARVFGVVGVLAGILIAPVAAGTAAYFLEQVMRPLSLRLRRGAGRPLRAGVWATTAAVALADGTNDGQKAMGILTASVSGAAALAPGGSGISWPVRVACSTILAACTVLGGRRIVVTVARRLWRSNTVDDLAAEGSAASLIFLAGSVGLPLSTSTVVTSAKVGAGASRRPRHLNRHQVVRVLATWLVTLPASAAGGALLIGCSRLLR
ncbi:MAG TPA: inorganic phosphate transporter [Acidimicrobiales bacterium]|nr:inorganic phosphate transporter [Acidimicrobiales bacterium]